MFEERTFTVEMDATSTCRQLLNKACHMLYPGRVIHFIHIHIQVYELTVGPEDKERLKMISDVVNECVRLCDIDVTSFRIRLSQF